MVSQLLGSKISTDIVESINFFTVATKFQLQNSIFGVRKMLALVWSKDNDIREGVMASYRELYFSADKALYPSAKVRTSILHSYVSHTAFTGVLAISW